MEHLVTFQPAVGTIDQPNQVYLARGADRVASEPDINEAETIAWIPVGQVQQQMADGGIAGAGSVTGLLSVLLAKAHGQL